MSQKKLLSILEFSRLTGIKRENLRFYDRIGLLIPSVRGDNGYRYYTRRQLTSGYLINSLRLLGVGLEDIRKYSANRTPEKMLALFAEQEALIQAEMNKLREASEIMELYAGRAREALLRAENKFLTERRKRERIFLCPPAPAGASEDEGELLAYGYASSHGINPGCPIGVMIARQDFLSPDPLRAYRYYFRAGKKGNAWKPGGLYAVAYGKSDALEAGDLCRRLLEFAGGQGLETAGDAYGEYLLDDLAVPGPEQYFGRIEVLVKGEASPQEG